MSVICSACNTEVVFDTSCSHCGHSFTSPDNGNQLDQTFNGDGNQGVQAGRDINGTVIINPAEPEEEKTLIYRSFIKPLTIADQQIKTWWFFIPGALGFLGSIASIVGTWMTLASNTDSLSTPPSHSMFYIIAISMLLLFLGFILQRSKYLTLLFFNKTIEADRGGNLFITQITGTCCLCKSPVKIKTIGPKENRQTMVICTNNPDQHLWYFDRTVLPDVGDDYRNNL